MPPNQAAGQHARLLVVDDELGVLESLSTLLESRGYHVSTASDGPRALEAFGAERPDVVLLDTGMPVMDGVEVCRRMRAASSAQILVLSALMDEPQKIRALDAGADDYVTKPFSVEELLARVRTAVRRAHTQQQDNAVLHGGGIEVHQLARRVLVDGREVHLTTTEYEVMRVLIANPDRLLTRQYLLTAALGPAYRDALDNLRTVINQLRRKIEPEPRQPRRIITEPGVGYRFRSD